MAVLITGTAFHFGKTWLPAAANPFAAEFDTAWKWNLVLFGAAFVITQSLLAWWAVRVPAKVEPEAQPSLTVEVAWALVALFLFVGVALATARTWEQDKPLGSRADAIQIEVVAQQFRWYFRYPGADQRFARTALQLVDASEGNPLGIDRNDPAARDDRVSAVLVVPADRDIELDVRSYDVIHSLFIPDLRFKQDAVPGMEIPIHFRFSKPGAHEIACAELCGLGHHQMNAKVLVLSAADYAAWEGGR
jgi:cytochrome c oxidase subunit 2